MDRIYRCGTAGNAGDDPLARLLPVGNQGPCYCANTTGRLHMAGPSWAAVWTLIAGVVVTIVGATATLVANRRNDRLKAQLDFVNMQLRYFYGPLLANAEASQRALAAFKRQYYPKADGDVFWDPANPPTPEVIVTWRHWVITVFMPLNLRTVEVISKRSDLVIGEGMPQCLVDVCAHVLTLKAALASWQDDPHYVPTWSPYPARVLLDYLRSSFSTLKKEQVKLLKAVAETSEHPLTENSAEISLISDRWQNPQSTTRTDPGHIRGT